MIGATRTFHRQPRNATGIRPWTWPLPKIDDHAPTLRSHTSGAHPHAEIAYQDGYAAQRVVPVFAAQDGVIAFARRSSITSDGNALARYSLCLDHAGGWSTRYGNLEHMFSVSVDRFARRRKPRVRAGDILGCASRSPPSLSFELWRGDADQYGPVAPEPHMRDWLVIPWSDAPMARETTEQPIKRIAA